ncbi:MAG: methylmalonyl-CoA mutase subunit beta [Candidatus Lambdaproteobacteria bacterium]|nr:methylmalonyl-CoA mutase subunit beta [Candidatus Lambdaproteobacteria bacterium]
MTEKTLTFRNAFPPRGRADWMRLVERDLKGAPFERLVTRTSEGIDLQPLYTAEDWPVAGESVPGSDLPPYALAPSPAGAGPEGWRVCQEQAHPNPEQARRDIAQDVAGGATALRLQLAAAGSEAEQADPGPGVWAETAEALAALLSDVPADVPGGSPADPPAPPVALLLAPGGDFLAQAALLAAARGWGHEHPAAWAGAYGADPLGALARTGRLPGSLEQAWNQLAHLVSWSARETPALTALVASAAPYHDAGADNAQELAFALATAVASLRELEARGVALETALGQMAVELALDDELFLGIAKLRAARRLWARVAEACAVAPEGRGLRLFARTSVRMMTRRDPWVNLLRTTVAGFAGAVGGAELLSVLPHDAALGLPDDLSRRIARNAQLILREEAQLHRVLDPAGGSWYLERLTDELAGRAWAHFQRIEGAGGMVAALLDGTVLREIDAVWERRRADVARRKRPLTGVSAFPDLDEPADTRPAAPRARPGRPPGRTVSPPEAAEPLRRLRELAAGGGSATGALMEATLAAARAGATLAALGEALHPAPAAGAAPVRTTPLPLRQLSADYEALRDASDAAAARPGGRPKAFLAALGSPADRGPRSEFARTFFQAGGFETPGATGGSDLPAVAAAFRRSGALLAVICGSDAAYEAQAAALAPLLKAAGARRVLLAGQPGRREPEWRAAGIDGFIHRDSDVPATLSHLLRLPGVAP